MKKHKHKFEEIRLIIDRDEHGMNGFEIKQAVLKCLYCDEKKKGAIVVQWMKKTEINNYCNERKSWKFTKYTGNKRWKG